MPTKVRVLDEPVRCVGSQCGVNIKLDKGLDGYVVEKHNQEDIERHRGGSGNSNSGAQAQEAEQLVRTGYT